MWQLEYRADRYMSHLNENELKQWTKDIFNNLLILTEDSKIGLIPVNSSHDIWMRKFQHVLEELSIRYGPYPSGFRDGFMKDVRIPRPETPLAKKAGKVVSKHRYQYSTYLVKYGKMEYLEKAFKLGDIRICPATFYDDPSLNPSIRDQELEMYIQPHPSKMRMEVLDKETMKPKRIINPIGNIISANSETNYYVYCLSTVLSLRLFCDFDSDSCLIIKDVKLFIKNIFKGFRDIISGWHGVASQVKYLDPLFSTLQDIDIYLTKHFRYSYQKEFSVVWLPKQIIKDIGIISVNIKGMENYCDLIYTGDT